MAKKPKQTKKSAHAPGSRSGKVRTKKAVRPPKARHARRKGRFQLLYGAVSKVVMAVAVVAGTLVFFRVDTVAVSGNERYTEQEIVSASRIQNGDNLFLLNKYTVQASLVKNLPYVGEVSIQRDLPGTIEIQVEERLPVAAIRISNGYWYIDSDGRLLEMREENQVLIEITGISLLSPVGGETLTVDSSQDLRARALVDLLAALEKADILDNASTIDLSEGSSLTMNYTDKYRVKIPYGADYDYKIRAMEGIVDAQAADNDVRSGLIDLTMDNEWHFIPD
jgi:cell division protein FtsQ